MRLKGDSIDHLENNKWSMRVKGKNGNTILGMRNFHYNNQVQEIILENFFIIFY